MSLSKLHLCLQPILDGCTSALQLVSMGFDPSNAAAALQQSHNDIQGALARLL